MANTHTDARYMCVYRQLMTELEGSQPASSGTDNSGGGGAVGRANDHDDFIQRLENLQSRLSGSSPQNGQS